MNMGSWKPTKRTGDMGLSCYNCNIKPLGNAQSMFGIKFYQFHYTQ